MLDKSPIRSTRAVVRASGAGTRRPVRVAALLAAATLVTGCGLFGGDSQHHTSKLPERIDVTSPRMHDGGTIPAQFTCEGAGTSPPLRWTGVPKDAKELALVVDDPDAPGGTYVHWVVFHISPDTTGIAEGSLPAGARQAKNSGGKVGFTPPCPPSGVHRYRFTVYAMREQIDLPNGSGLHEVFHAISRRATSQGRMVARFGR